MENQQEQQMIQCKTKDNEVVNVRLDWLRQSKTFKTMSEDMGLDLDDPNLIFPVSALTTASFQKCMEWCQHHIEVPDAEFARDPITQQAIWFEMNDQEKQFFKIKSKELENLLIAATYLDIRSLYLYAVQAMTAVIMELQAEEHHDELRELLGEPDDLTPEQKEKIKKENVYSLTLTKK
uniref:Skp1-related protein n=1 Tax=Ditylenchus dipsaci TaxID=166011 RepID=A0A915EJI4_9BILA